VDRPVSLHRDPDNFKVYMSDTGMLIRLQDGSSGSDTMLRSVYSGDSKVNQGALMENVVAECLMKSGIICSYYINHKNPGRMELDFVIDLGPDVTVIEVKSGKSRDSPSLSKTLDDDRFDRRIKFEKINIHVDEDGVEHYPLFAAAFMDSISREVESLDTYAIDNRRKYKEFLDGYGGCASNQS
jgi:predicted AAA+ superfamily ATPase